MHFQEIFGLIVRHQNSIAATLLHGPQAFEPIFGEREVEGKTYLIVDEWCHGYMRGVALDADAWSASEADIEEFMSQGAEEFRNQFPAYRDNPVEETRRALAALEKDEVYANSYAEFVQLMVYGERPTYLDAMQTVASLTKDLLVSLSP